MREKNDRTGGLLMKTKQITATALMAALVFTGTFFFKIPTPMNGYVHLGDCMIILAVVLIGPLQGAFAGAIGAGLSDLLGGYAIYVLPTVIIKSLLAILVGLFAYRILKGRKYGWLVGAIVGSIVHIFLYTLTAAILYGFYGAIADLPLNIVQSVCGVVCSAVLIILFEKSHVMERLKRLSH